MQIIPIFVGFDPREEAGTHTFNASLLAHTTRPYAVIPLSKKQLDKHLGEHFQTGTNDFTVTHDKTFYHPPGILFKVSDTWEPEAITSATVRVRDEFFTRIGTDLRFNGIAIENTSGSPDVFARAVSTVEESADLRFVLMSPNMDSLNAALIQVGSYQPLIHAATKENFREICAVDKKT